MEGIRQNVLDFVQPHRHNWINATPVEDEPVEVQGLLPSSVDPPSIDATRLREARKTGILVGGVAAVFAGIVITTVLNVRSLERYGAIGLMGLGGAFIGSDLIAKQLCREEE